MAQPLRALAVLTEVLSSIPRTHMKAQNHLGTRHTCGTYIYIHVGLIPHKVKEKF